MARVHIPVAEIEFDEDGNTIWIRSPQGGTVLRIITRGKIVLDRCPTATMSHGDVRAEGDIRLCLADDARKEGFRWRTEGCDGLYWWLQCQPGVEPVGEVRYFTKGSENDGWDAIIRGEIIDTFDSCRKAKLAVRRELANKVEK